jgi:hypothetical protein
VGTAALGCPVERSSTVLELVARIMPLGGAALQRCDKNPIKITEALASGGTPEKVWRHSGGPRFDQRAEESHAKSKSPPPELIDTVNHIIYT